MVTKITVLINRGMAIISVIRVGIISVIRRDSISMNQTSGMEISYSCCEYSYLTYSRCSFGKLIIQGEIISVIRVERASLIREGVISFDNMKLFQPLAHNRFSYTRRENVSYPGGTERFTSREPYCDDVNFEIHLSCTVSRRQNDRNTGIQLAARHRLSINKITPLNLVLHRRRNEISIETRAINTRSPRPFHYLDFQKRNTSQHCNKISICQMHIRFFVFFVHWSSRRAPRRYSNDIPRSVVDFKDFRTRKTT